MTNIVPFENAPVPAYLKKKEGKKGNLSAIAEAILGYPVISIKGKVFTLKRGDEKTPIRKPAPHDDEPAAFIEAVVLGIGPVGANYAKQFYNKGYTEGADDKPTCYSDDGIAPAADAAEPQAKKCATCAHNQFGAKITEAGKKAKACADSKRLAIAQVGALDDAMLIRVPAASLKAFREYVKLLDSRGFVDSQAVVTKIGFEIMAAHPQLTFKPVGILDSATYEAAMVASESDLVKRITGLQPIERAAVENEEAFETMAVPAPAPAPAPAAAKPSKPKPAPAPAPTPAPEVIEDDDLPVAPVKASIAVEATPAKVAKPTPAPAPAPIPQVDAALGAALDDMDLDFDD